ncbi:hypothetical protein D3C80_457460 [compost metagenome]
MADKTLTEVRINRTMDKDALSADAILPCCPEGTRHAGLHGRFHITIFKHKNRGISSEIHCQLLQPGTTSDGFSCCKTTRKGNHPNFANLYQSFTQVDAPRSRSNHRGWKTRFHQALNELESRQRREFRRFQNHGISTGDCGAEFMGDQIQRIVIGGDCDDKSQGFPREPTLTRLRSFISPKWNHFPGVTTRLLRR